MKEQKGITLIALVITIIVLLILAGVTIAMLTSDNSAPQKATEAAQKDAISAVKDDVAMRVSEALLQYYDNTYVNASSTSSSGAANPLAKVNEAVNAAVDAHHQKGDITSMTYTAATASAEGTITIETKGYTQTGKVTSKGGITWQALATK